MNLHCVLPAAYSCVTHYSAFNLLPVCKCQPDLEYNLCLQSEEMYSTFILQTCVSVSFFFFFLHAPRCTFPFSCSCSSRLRVIHVSPGLFSLREVTLWNPSSCHCGSSALAPCCWQLQKHLILFFSTSL